MLLNNTYIGLTGGIGSGKSTAANFFQDLGAQIVCTDKLTHELLTPNTTCWQAITKKFGNEILQNNTINKAKLRSIIYTDPQAKLWLEQLLHPKVFTKLNKLPLINSYYIIEIPLLFETKSQLKFDRSCLVDVPTSTQIIRVTQNKGWSKNEVTQVIKSQLNRTTKLQLADDILDNSTTKAKLSQQIIELHQQYLQIHQQKNQM